MGANAQNTDWESTVGKTIKTLVSAAALAAMSQAAPASAQYMPHLDPNLYMLAVMNMSGGADPCMAGTAMSDAKVAEARTPAPGVMQAYFAAAQAGGAKSAAFHLDKNTAWKAGGVSAGMVDLDRQSDPLAVAGNVLQPEPLRFYRGGTGATALGQWAVLDGQGQVAGLYTGLFTRVKKVWKLRELTVSRADDTVEPAAQFCRKPGDVMESRLSSTKTWRENAQKSVEEARRKLAEATAKEATAKAALEAKPRDTRQSLAARDAARSVSYWTKQIETREKNLADAVKKSGEAQKDADEIKRLTGPARNALAFRVVPEPADAAGK